MILTCPDPGCGAHLDVGPGAFVGGYARCSACDLVFHQLTDTPVAPGASVEAEPYPWSERIRDIFFRPGRLGRKLVGRPQWIAPMLLAGLLVFMLASLPAGVSGRGRELEARARSWLSEDLEIGLPEDPDEGPPRSSVLVVSILGILLGTPFACVLQAGFLWGVFSTLGGRKVPFRLHLAIVAHTHLIDATGTVVREWMRLVTLNPLASASLGFLAPSPGYFDPTFGLLDMIDLFNVWAFLSCACALAAAGGGSRARIASSLLLAYVVISGGLIGCAASLRPLARALRSSTGDQASTIRRGTRLDDLVFEGLTGEPVSVPAMRGRVVLVDFWATWCGPCVAELPDLKRTFDRHHSRGFEVIGISLDEDPSTLRSFIETRKIPWPQHFDGKGWKNAFADRHRVRAIPFTVLLDRRGRVRYTGLRGKELERAVEDLLKEPVPPPPDSVTGAAEAELPRSGRTSTP